ncbi:putative nuclease HARBI1 [Phlebotomus papatasi]|uniref:putative nuclease HARBI1 n=1 Tax=Phlebotomus papatasi TaxID=29031 RepID=UPI002483BCC3|nr:putative nuclease HARBI1 [Phlebotomus papatasi]XP_055712244.1 putative nuclease HARBI1 [Phlebotomus papatasi]
MDELHRGYRKARKYLRLTAKAFELSDANFQRLFGLTKPLVRLLIEDLTPHVRQADRNTKIPLNLKVLVALNFYCSGSYQKRVGQDFLTCLSQASVSRIIREISQLIAHNLLNKYITFPNTRASAERTKAGFQEKYGIYGVIGVIDGTHIRLSGLNRASAHSFFNRKRYYSLNVMMVCDSDCYISALNANFPGSAHDSHIWRMSDLNTYLERKCYSSQNDTFLLGDKAYGLTPWLLTPLRGNLSRQEKAYNKWHRTARLSIERTFGILKNRYRCLNGKERALRYNPEIASYIVASCCVLHNLSVIASLPRVDATMYGNDSEIPDTANARMAMDVCSMGRIVQRRIVNMMNPHLE